MKNIIYLLMITVAVSACKQNYGSEAADTEVVKAARVTVLEPTSDPLPIFASGKIDALKSMKLSFKLGGILRDLRLEEGQNVRKGQLMAKLDLSEINSQVAQAQAGVDKAQRDVNRFRQLYLDSAATLQSVQDLETQLTVAEAQLAIATFNQAYSEIYAPASGKVVARMAEENELVSPGQPIYEITAQSGGMSLNVGLSDKDVVQIKLGDKADLSIDAYSGRIAKAVVTEIAADAHPVTGTYKVELTITSFDRPLKNGFFAKAKIYASAFKDYYKVPVNALVTGEQERVTVYVQQEDTVRASSFQPLYIGEDFVVAATNDLSNTAVLTEGAQYLQEGEFFQPLKATDTP